MKQEHLGERVHDLLDNRLTPLQAADAMAHLDVCADCRTRWAELRAAREALQSSPAGIDMSFAQQLLDRDRMSQIAQRESKRDARAAAGHAHRPMMALVVMLIVLSSGVVGAYAAGAPERVEPAFADGADSDDNTVSYMTSTSMRSDDVLSAWAHPEWDSADVKPVEARVVHDAYGDDVLLLWLVAGSETIVVAEQRGSLDYAAADAYPRVDLGGVTAFLVSEQPRRLLWETGDFVVSAACECTAATLEAAAASFPATSTPGFLDRVGDGAMRIAQVLTGE
ncbi:anti-sigma factor family protein [Demequina globuliformis]|uniref:anti-sigma factor family protein n=1 Tax=Demequina globuliformis TaxID=676202 RepID=UPI000781CAC7|nr:zf-HC2 domain-containing protein [Demequina globuliformis]